MVRHRYTVERKILTDDDGNPIRLSDYWRLVCRDCDWKGTRISNPSIGQSKERMREWRVHAAETD